MRTLHDNELNIDWINILCTDTNTMPEYYEYIRQMNEWTNNSDIRRFIGEDNIGEFVDYLLHDITDTDLYLAKSGDEIVAAALLSHQVPLVRIDDILDYLYHKKSPSNYKDNIIADEEFLTTPELEKLIKNRDENNLYIEYLIVNPKYHGRGIATQFYKTLKDNMEFFGGSEAKFMQASIIEDNIGSRKAIIKNGFKRMCPTDKCPRYSVYYIHTQNKNYNEEKSQ